MPQIAKEEQGDVIEDKERHWTDARVRFTPANHNVDEEEEQKGPDDDDDESSADDSFVPNPSTSFCHSFQHPSSEISIDIELQGYEETSDTIYVSTGLTLWKSSQLLCDYMLAEGYDHLRQSRRFLELGAGLGLNGLLAYQLLVNLCMEGHGDTVGSEVSSHETAHVILTDGDTNALSVLRDNVSANTVNLTQDASKSNTRIGVNISVQQLLWGTQTARTFLQNHQSVLEKENGKDDEKHGCFDLILASDAIYVLENVQPLLETVDVLLSLRGEFWFSYCSRRQVGVQVEDVLSAAHQMGFSSTLISKRDMQADNGLSAYVFRRRD